MEETRESVPTLEVRGLSAGYSEILVLADVSLAVQPRSLTALVGPNGAGKTTLLRAVSGLLRLRGGSVHHAGDIITGLSPEAIVARGVALVPEGRHLFPDMNVLDNLRMGAYLPRAHEVWKETADEVFGLFPILQERKRQKAKTLSGGEAQMLAIARALMSRPSLILLDEPSLGLAPQVVGQVFDVLRRLPSEDVAVFVVEQNVRQILALADKGYVLARGKVVGEGSGKDLLSKDLIRNAFLGL